MNMGQGWERNEAMIFLCSRMNSLSWMVLLRPLPVVVAGLGGTGTKLVSWEWALAKLQDQVNALTGLFGLQSFSLHL